MSTQQVTPTPQPSSPSGNIFDQLANGSAPSSVELRSPSQDPQASSPQGGGNIFDRMANGTDDSSVTLRSTPPPTPSAGASAAAGIGQAGSDIWDVVKHAVQHPIDTAQSFATSGGLVGSLKDFSDTVKEGIPLFHAYETARAQGKGVMESLSAANDEAKKQDDANSVLLKRIDDFKKNPVQATARAVGDAAATAAAMYAGGKAAGALMPEAAEAGASALNEGVDAVTAPVKSRIFGTPPSEVQQGIADISKSAGGVTEPIVPTAADPYGLRQVADAQIGKYKAAANKLDELSGNKFSDAQQAVSDASDDFTAAGKKEFRQAQQNLDNIIEEYKPALAEAGIDTDGMKANYRQGMANNKIAAFLDKTTQESGKGSAALTAQAKSGPGLKEAVLDLAQNNKDLLGRAGWDDIHINGAAAAARSLDTVSLKSMIKAIVAHKVEAGIVGLTGAAAYKALK